ncbi:hypothetical protein AAG906_025565 [Vitis piasezkii]
MKKYADCDHRPLEFQVAYMLKLPERLKLHPTFHVSFLKPYHEDLDVDKRAPPLKLHGREMLPCGNLRRRSRHTSKLRKCLMGRPCTHESLGRKQGKPGGKTLIAPIGHHGTALGMPRTHGWDSSTHTWAPRHARGRLNLVRGVMPCTSRRISHGRNAMAHTWSTGWCTLLSSKGLDQRHAGGHSIIRGTLRGRRQLVRGTLQQLSEKGSRRWQLTNAAS